MKILIIPIFYFLFNHVNVTVIDEKSGEILIGVKDYKSKNYTNFDGQLKIKKGDTLHLNLVSYEEIIINNIKNDTVIKMK